MVFVSGIHGVGKSFFCERVKEQLGIEYYSASQLITARRHKGLSGNKLVPDIDDNQPLLIEALRELRDSNKEFILDGHFCLLNAEGEITKIPSETYTLLKPDRMVLLTEEPSVIASRREVRDGVRQDLLEIETFQREEKAYAEEIAASLKIPLIVSHGASDLQRIIEWIRSGGN